MGNEIGAMVRLASVVLLAVFVAFLSHPALCQESGSAEWFEFSIPLVDCTPSFIDVLTGAEVPAGQYEFVQVGEDGHFYFENGRRIRFWGVAIGHQALFPPKELAEAMASRLAKFGFNLVRIDALDRYIFYDEGEDTQHFDPRKLDRFDYLVSQLKKHGIYISIIITVHRTFRANDSVIDWDNPNFSSPEECIKYGNERLLRTMAMFDPYLNRLQREYARALLAHRNPYTGNRYAEESALAFLEIINETTLDHAWLRNQLNHDSTSSTKVTRYYSGELDVLWNIWLLGRYESKEKLAQAWSSSTKKGLLPDEDPARRTVRRILYSEKDKFSEARVQDLQSFYHELQQQYFTGFCNFLKDEVGVKVPISGTHTFHGMPNQVVQSYMDFTGVHTYWEHPVLQPCKKWTESCISILNTPMVNAETFQTPDAVDWIETRNTLYRIAFGATVNRKPLVISEYNHPFPNEYQAEFPLIISAYGSLQDWDGIVIHSYMYGEPR